jgi:hypothetical protein
MDIISTPLAIALSILGALVLAAATVVALGERVEPRARGRRPGMLVGLVPWIGSLLVVVLLVRGAVAGAVVVGLATLLHAGVMRAMATRTSR